jgi:hypothetical protein
LPNRPRALNAAPRAAVAAGPTVLSRNKPLAPSGVRAVGLQ